VTSVPGELHYLAPESTVLRRFTAPGASVNTGSYESHTVPIRNGRPVQDSFRLDTHGFELVRHRSAAHDFTDRAEVDAVYAGCWPRARGAYSALRRRTGRALCDFRSVGNDEGLPNQLYFVDRVPDDPFAPVDESKMITSGSEFHYSPDHEWWYFPDMTRDELLFLAFNESTTTERGGSYTRRFGIRRSTPQCRGTASRSPRSLSSTDG
jgi:hypothetical protein